MNWEQWKERLKKGKFVLLILIVGIVLMLIPTGSKTQSRDKGQTAAFSLEDTQQHMEQLLTKMEGVGRCEVMLSLESSSRLTLARDSNETRREGEQKTQSEVLTVNRGSGCQEVVITEEIYPVFKGAVVVCDGADSSSVKLNIVQTVSALTGLGSDKISVVKWKS